jgi:3',5'-cyclic AMP phosphodiesterase CpdA
VRTIAQLADLHFGRADRNLLDPLVEAVQEARPDVVVVCGDLTQRARRRQFREAREFLDRLPGAHIVVPGNHDVPLFNLLARFLWPLSGYQQGITADLEPFYSDEELAIAGVNTARSWTHKGGRINVAQIDRVAERLRGIGPGVVKMVATHHPFDLAAPFRERDLVGRAALAMKVFAEAGVDVLLAGHFHIGQTTSTAARYRIEGYAALVIQASTAVSTRARGEPNSFNVLRVSRDSIVVDRLIWKAEGRRFARTGVEEFRRGSAGWARAEPSA